MLKEALINRMEETSKRRAHQINGKLDQTVNSTVMIATIDLNKKVTRQEMEIRTIGNKYQQSRNRLLKLESCSIRENLSISGITEEYNETEQIVYDTLGKLFLKLNIEPNHIDIVHSHRMPSRGTGSKLKFAKIDDSQRIS